MIDWLRRAFGQKSTDAAAPLNNSLLLVVGRRAPRGLGQLRGSGSFGTRPGRRTVSIYELTGDEEEVPPHTTGLGKLLGGLAPRLDEDERGRLHEFIVSTVLPDLEKPGAYALAKTLHLIRERLRKGLPGLTFESAGEPTVVDALVMVDERSLWVVGWCMDGDDTLRRIELISPEGQRVGTLEGAYRYPRPDVEESWASVGIKSANHGFIKHLELSAPSLLSEGWLGELRGPSGSGFQILTPPVIRDPAEARARILSEASADRPNIEELRRDHAYAALSRLGARVRNSVAVDTIQHGDVRSSPDVSIIVPLYGRVDLLEHQITQFWQDPDIAAAELIYVLDSPELRPEAARLAAELHALYGLPFTLLRLDHNVGFATANNLATAHASGRLLLLLNSDVLPAGPGWLGTMRDFHDATPAIGALGPKLLYEDGSLQHAGMYFKRDPATRYWWPQHYYKGFSHSLAAANVNRPVPAVTGACMMIDRVLYQELGGLSEHYIQGGFEDSDLCLRLIERGLQNWYLASVELYHLEAQSFPITFRPANPYNAWLQTHLWDGHIQKVMRSEPEGVDTHLVAVG